MTALRARQVRHRYLVLLALRWLPVGLCIPLAVLLPLSRGLTVAEVGVAASLQGFVVLALELPTGGLSDSWGRRPTLALSAAVALVSLFLFVFADSFAAFAVFAALQGVYRALDSGPLEAWFVDATLAADPSAKLERGLSAGGTVLGCAVGAGALATGGIVAWVQVAGVPTLVLPVILALVLQLGGLAAIVLLMREPAHPDGRRALFASLRGVPAMIREGLGILRRSRVLLCLVLVELCWGFGVVAFESLMPMRLADLVGGPERAAVITGPAGAVAWLASAAGAALIPLLTKRIGVSVSALAMRIAQGVTVVGMGLLAGPVGVLTGYLATYAVHGAANPVHMTLLHREVDGRHRSTVVSMNSMLAQPGGSLGLIVLTAIASGTSVPAAMIVGAVVLAAAAPLYLPAMRSERRERVSV